MARPGKFESSGSVGEALWELSLDGVDAELGSTDEPPGRWWGLLTKTGIKGARHAIVTADSQGFSES